MIRKPLYNASSLFTAQKLVKLEYDYTWYTEILPTIWPKESSSMTLKEALERLYKLMLSEYRCEYVYKNEIIRQILIKGHKNEARAFTEVEVQKSIADVVIINGTSSVYEIKTELDGLNRLENQLHSYRLVFDKMFVVTHKEKLDSIKKVIGKDVGLIILKDKGKLETVREAKSNKKHVRSEYVFNLLHKEEYTKIIKSHFGYIPKVQPIQLFTECKRLFSLIEPIKAHTYMVKALRNRRTPWYQEDLFKALPHSLKLIGLTSRLTKQNCIDIQNRLSLIAS